MNDDAFVHGGQGEQTPRGREHAGPELRVLELDGLELVVLAIASEAPAEGLTPAEEEVARLVIEGCSNQEVAARRGASVKTVANQLRRIYSKLGIVSRYELAARLGC